MSSSELSSPAAVHSLQRPVQTTGELPREVFAEKYADLHRIAVRELRRHAAGAITWSPTTLLHETFLKLSPQESRAFGSKARFIAYSSRAMRSVLIDHARRRNALKRGAEYATAAVSGDLADIVATDEQFERLGEALDSLGTIEPRLAQCVDLKFFCGYSFGEIAQLWRVSERTVQRDWNKARLLLNRLLDYSIDSLPTLP